MTDTVHLSKQSTPYALLTLLKSHDLVDVFHSEQDAVIIRPNAVVVAWHDSDDDPHVVEFLFAENVHVLPVDGEAILAHSLIELMLDSFCSDVFVSQLLALSEGVEFTNESLGLPPQFDVQQYLIGNAGIEWRGLIREDWLPTY